MPIFYRIVKTDPPTEADSLSYEALGIPLRSDTPELRRSWAAILVFSTPDAARRLVARRPAIGSFIAVLDVPAGGPVRYEQSGRVREHFDLSGEARDMLRMVTAVLRA
jgi:predicted component of type VI protein secretion system